MRSCLKLFILSKYTNDISEMLTRKHSKENTH